jgi:GH24 family phage-related lysozyme (muramidase)
VSSSGFSSSLRAPCILAHRDELTAQNRAKFTRVNPGLSTSVFDAREKSWAGQANLGAGRLQTSTLRRRVNQKDWSSAVNELRRWVHGGGTVLSGLVVRREAEAKYLLA